MKLILEAQNMTYTTLRNLSFAPEVDLTGQSLPLNEFTVDVETEDTLQTGQFAKLLDDLDRVWARYWVTKVDRKTLKLSTLKAQTPLIWLERSRMPAALISDTLGGAIDRCFDVVADVVGPVGGYCVIDSGIANTPVYGFCPEQSARERVQSLLMAAGAYIRTWNDTEMRVLPSPHMWDADRGWGDILQADRVFWRPNLIQGDAASHLTLKYYSVDNYDTGGSTVQDAYGNTFWVTEGSIGASSTGAGNEISIGGNMLVGYDSAHAIWPQFEQIYFWAPHRVEADVIDNAEIWPGDLVTFQLDEEGQKLCTGYVNSVEFAFGVQSRARIRLDSASVLNAARVTINWTHDGWTVYSETRIYPPGYTTHEDLPNKDVLTNGHLTEYDPVDPSVEIEAGTDVDVPCDKVSETDLITGETISDFTPHHIAVTTPPDQTAYFDGGRIDYTGMVVKVYNAEGQLLNSETIPEGVIPMDQLTLPVARADFDAVTETVEWGTADALIKAVEVLCDEPGRSYATWQTFYYGGDLGMNGNGITGGCTQDKIASILLTRYNGQSYAMAVDNIDDLRYTFGGYQADGWRLRQSSYWTSHNEAPYHVFGFGKPLLTDTYDYSRLPESAIDPEGVALEDLIKLKGGQLIPVQWTVPGTETVLEAAFEITVAPGYGGDEP